MDNSKSDRSTGSQFPDLYRLLKLAPLETDTGKIKAALQRVASQLRDHSGSKQSARNLKKVFELGNQYLLNAQAKAKYDHQWKSRFGAAPQLEAVESHHASATEQPVATSDKHHTEWDLSSVEPLLPQGDPTRAFDLAEFLESAPASESADAQQEFSRLTALFDNSARADNLATHPPAIESESVVSQPVAPVPQTITPETTTSSPSPNVGPSQQVVKTALLVQPPGGQLAGRTLSRRLRKRRERSLLLTVTVVLVGLAAALGILVVVLPQNDEPENATNRVAVRPERVNADRAIKETTPTRSGLPQVSGLNGVDVTPAAPPADKQESLQTERESPNPSPDSDATNESQSDAVTMDDATPPEPTETVPPPADMKTVADLSDTDKEQWQDGMNGIHTTLGQQFYDIAKDNLGRARALAETKVQLQQASRLQRIADLAMEYHTELLKAIDGLSAGDVFRVRSQPISFVEFNEDMLTLRIRGRNTTFRLTELPIGVAHGLVDLVMDIEHPLSLARKAAFTLVHPASADIALRNAKDMMAEAISANAVPADTLRIFDEDYKL